MPRARRGALDSAPVGRGVFRRPRVALPGAAAVGRQKVDSRQMGCEREQPQGAVLFADAQRTRATVGKDQRVAAADPSHGSDSGVEQRASARGGITMFQRKRSAEDFAEEIKAHLELEADDLKQEGLSEDEARWKARREFEIGRASWRE